MIEYLIFGKETSHVKKLEFDLKLMNYFRFIGLFENYKLLSSIVYDYRPQVVFIDLDYVDNYGMVSNLSKKCIFIAYSKNKDLAYSAFDLGCRQFLYFPYSITSLLKVISFVYNDFSRVEEKLCIHINKEYQFIDILSLVYLKADNNTTDLFFENGTQVKIFKTLKTFEKLLPFNFCRVHRSYIINYNHVTRINFSNFKLLLNNKVPVPFTNKYKIHLEHRLSASSILNLS